MDFREPLFALPRIEIAAYGNPGSLPHRLIVKPGLQRQLLDGFTYRATDFDQDLTRFRPLDQPHDCHLRLCYQLASSIHDEGSYGGATIHHAVTTAHDPCIQRNDTLAIQRHPAVLNLPDDFGRTGSQPDDRSVFRNNGICDLTRPRDAGMFGLMADLS